MNLPLAKFASFALPKIYPYIFEHLVLKTTYSNVHEDKRIGLIKTSTIKSTVFLLCGVNYNFEVLVP